MTALFPNFNWLTGEVYSWSPVKDLNGQPITPAEEREMTREEFLEAWNRGDIKISGAPSNNDIKRSSTDIFTGFFTDFLPDVGKVMVEGAKEVSGVVEKEVDDLTGGLLTDAEKLIKLLLNLLEKLIEIFPKLIDFAQWIIDYIFEIINDPDLGTKLKIFGWVAVGAVIFWLAFPVILNKIL